MLKRLGVLALILSAGAVLPAAAFAQDGYRGGYYYSADHRYNSRHREERQRDDHWRNERREHEWRERESRGRYYNRGYYAPNYYYAPAPNYYYSPGANCPY